MVIKIGRLNESKYQSGDFKSSEFMLKTASGNVVDKEALIEYLKNNGYRFVAGTYKDANHNRQGYQFVFYNGTSYIEYHRSGGDPNGSEILTISSTLPKTPSYKFSSFDKVHDLKKEASKYSSLLKDFKSSGLMESYINEAGVPVPKDSPLGKFLVKVMEHERSFMDEDDGVETDRYLWSRRVLSGEVTVESMIQYFKRHYSEDEPEFIKRLETVAGMDRSENESDSINEALELLMSDRDELLSLLVKLRTEASEALYAAQELKDYGECWSILTYLVQDSKTTADYLKRLIDNGRKQESVRVDESVGYDVSGTTPTGAGDYNIDEERGISSPAKAIELWFKIEAEHPLNTDISAYKKADAIALITWAHENQDKITEWHKKYGCPYKLESMIAAIERQFNNGCKSFHENEYGEMIDPFCIG